MKTLITAVALALASVTSFSQQTVASSETFYPQQDRVGREAIVRAQTGVTGAPESIYVHTDRVGREPTVQAQTGVRSTPESIYVQTDRMGREPIGATTGATNAASAERPATRRPLLEGFFDRRLPQDRMGLVPPQDWS